jgi:hypothetical protein
MHAMRGKLFSAATKRADHEYWPPALVGLGPRLEQRANHLLVAVDRGSEERKDAQVRLILQLVPHLGPERHEQGNLLLLAIL